MNTPGQGAGPGQVPIAIIGMGCLLPNASNLVEFWRSLRRGEDGIREVPPTHWSAEDYFDADPKRPDHTYCTRGGFIPSVPFDPTEFGIPPTTLEATDTAQLLSLVVAKAALDDAGYGEDRDFNRERVGVILGITGTQELVIPLAARLGHPLWRRALNEAGVSPEIAEDVIARIADGYVSWQENSFPGLLGNVVAGRIANRLNLGGTNCVVNAACASSLGAVHLSMMELATGRCDMALTGGADTLNDIFMHMCFSKTPALSPTGDARPFDESADGTVLGEGIGMLVLKRLEDAQRDGDRIYAVIRAIGTSSDGRSQSIYAPHAQGQARCLRNAYAAAGIEPDSVELIEAHGTGTKVGDAAEFEALKIVFREARTSGRWCALGSVKSQIGHTKAAAGAAGLIKAALALHHRALPPTLKVNRPNPSLGVEQSPFYLNTALRPWITTDHRPRRAGVSSFGFGGSNFHAVLEEQPSAVLEPAWDGSVQIIALSAESAEGLREALHQWRDIASDTGFDAAQLAFRGAASRQSFRAAHAHRLILVTETGDDVAATLDEAEKKLSPGAAEKHSSRSSIFYGTGPAIGKIAFLFPGQGSQYVGMFRDLACTFPELSRALADSGRDAPSDEASLADFVYPVAAFTEEEKFRQAAALARTENAQRALGALDLGLARVLERFGVRPNLVAGHSYGELVALCVADTFDAPTLHRLSRLRGRLMAAGDGDRGAMLAVQGPLEKIEQLLVAEKLDVIIANRNGPAQGVLSGPREEIARAAAACKTAGLACKKLDVSGAFHSTSMQSAVAPLRNALESIGFADAQLPVFANSTGDAYPSQVPAAKDLLANQLVRPVNFVRQIENMHHAGARTFIEVGPKTVLTGLVSAILGDRPHLALALDTSAGRNAGMADLARLLARLAADGHPVELAKWERAAAEPRKPKMVVPLVGANYRAPQSQRVPAKTRTSGHQERSRLESPNPPAMQPNKEIVMAEKDRELIASREPISAPPLEYSSDGPSVLPSPPVKPAIQAPKPLPPSASSSQPPNPMLTDALRIIQDGLRSMQVLQQQTAAAHERFLQSQEQAHRAIQSMLEGQQRLLAQSMGWSLPSQPVINTERAAQSAIPATAGKLHPQSTIATEPTKPDDPPPIIAPATPAVVEAEKSEFRNPNSAFSNVDSLVLDVVCVKTGYPREMINLDMDIEADLGIDSIKRVEIIAAIEERMPGLPTVKPEQMGSLRTLRQIVDFLAPAATSATTPATASAALGALPQTVQEAPAAAQPDFSALLLEVVAQRTGYPQEMLNLDMDLEADLGIDSIKRVEILAGVEVKIPNLPPVKPENMGALRTLQQIVEYYASSLPTAAPRTETTAAPTVTMSSALTTRVERSVLHLLDLPPAQDVALSIAPGRELWITDDGTPLASHLQNQLRQRGVKAEVLPTDEIIRRAGDERCAGLILLASLRQTAAGGWTRESEVALRSAFLAAKSAAAGLLSAAKAGSAIFATISRMDGAFGLEGSDFDPTQGALAGLAKTAAHEWPEVDCRALDVTLDWKEDAAAQAIVQELFADGPIEVALSPGRRRGLQTSPASVSSSPVQIAPGDVFIVTGGARGVTAETAVELAQAYRPTLVILGRSPLPADEPAWLHPLGNESEIKQAILHHDFKGRPTPSPAELKAAFDRYMAAREVRRNLARIAKAGATVHYVCVDVRQTADVKSALERVRRELGPVRGLIHAAGVLEDRLIKDKTAEQFDRVFDTKVAGLGNLLNAIDRNELRHIVLFSSVSARFGNIGQADYAMANEVLNKTAQRLSRELPHCRVVSINWGPWDGGMVSPSLKREFEKRGVELIPLEAGAKCLVEELSHGGSGVEVVLGGGLLPPANATNRRRRPAATSLPANDALHVAFERRLDLPRHEFLRSHVIGGHPVLPVAMTMEWLAHAALHGNPGLSFHGIDDLRVLKGVILKDEPITLRFLTARARRSSELFEVEASLHAHDARLGEITYARATVVLTSRQPTVPTPAIPDHIADRPYSRSMTEAYAEVLFHGPCLKGIRAVRGLGPAGMIAELSSAPPPRDWMTDPMRGQWLTDPLALDAAFQMAILWCAEELGAPSLPCKIGRYRQYRAAFPAEGVTASFEIRSAAAHKVTADICFFDRPGRLVAKIDDYECTPDVSLIPAFQGRSLAGAM